VPAELDIPSPSAPSAEPDAGSGGGEEKPPFQEYDPDHGLDDDDHHDDDDDVYDPNWNPGTPDDDHDDHHDDHDDEGEGGNGH
jgi:hypothetical protein